RVVKRFLAKDVLACLRGLHDQVGVRVRRGADEDGVDLRIGEDLRGAGCNFGDAQSRCDFLRCGCIDVRDGDRLCLRQSISESFRVDAADTARADDSYVDSFHALKLDSMDFRYSRLRRALSFGEPMPGSTSCSTSV